RTVAAPDIDLGEYTTESPASCGRDSRLDHRLDRKLERPGTPQWGLGEDENRDREACQRRLPGQTPKLVPTSGQSGTSGLQALSWIVWGCAALHPPYEGELRPSRTRSEARPRRQADFSRLKERIDNRVPGRSVRRGGW